MEEKLIPVPDYKYEIEKLENEITELEKKKTKFTPVTEKPPDFEPDICKAAENGKLSSVQYLVEIEKINVEAKNSSGCTPLHYASLNCNLDIVQYLVEECHSNVEAKDSSGWTPLHRASTYGRFDVVKYLVEECHARITDGIISDASSSVKEYLQSKR